MQAKPIFGMGDTHGILHQFQADIRGSSEGLGWSSVFASIQREHPFDGKLRAVSSNLMVLHRSGPVDMTYTVAGKPIARHVPKGGVFFLPAGHECGVSLHDSLETTHIYLRSDLFADHEHAAQNLVGGLAPILGEKDIVLEHLAAAIGDTIRGELPDSSLFVEPIAQAIANRFITINYGKPMQEVGKPSQRLSRLQIKRIRDFVEANLESDIRLDMLAALCGRSTEYFVRLFKVTTGVSPYQYVLNLRVERAKALLRDDARSISDLALHCGFSHQEHLTRTFRRFTGVTPGQYRRGF